MKKMLLLVLISFSMGIILNSCGEEELPPGEVKGYDVYTDKATKLEVKIPKGWLVTQKPNLLIAYSSAKARNTGLFDPYNMEIDEKDPAAKIEVLTIAMTDSLDFDYFFKQSKRFTENTYSQKKQVTIGGVKGWVQEYAFPRGYESKWEGEIYYAENPDTLGGMLTIVIFDALGGQFKTYYKPHFDQIIKDLKLAVRPPEEVKSKDSIVAKEPPSKKFMTVTGTGFAIDIPDNFKTYPAQKGKNVMAQFNYMGERRGDCNILVEQLDPKGKTDLKKIVDDIHKRIPAASPVQPMTLGAGTKGFVFAYSVRANSKSQAYFAMKDGKLFRITINWFTGMNPIDNKPEEPNYKEVFIRSAKSFKFQ